MKQRGVQEALPLFKNLRGSLAERQKKERFFFRNVAPEAPLSNPDEIQICQTRPGQSHDLSVTGVLSGVNGLFTLPHEKLPHHLN